MPATLMEDNAAPETSVSSDVSLRAKAIIQQAGVATTDIHCEVSGQSLALFGCVRSFYEKQVAQESVRKFFGIREVSNQLLVRS